MKGFTKTKHLFIIIKGTKRELVPLIREGGKY